MPVEVLPAASVAVALTLVVPSGKTPPDCGLKVTCTGPPTASSAVAAKVATAPWAEVASTTRSGGSESTGPVLSRTVTLKVAVEVLPAPSVAVALTWVVPSGNVLPEGMLKLTASGPSRLSSAVAV